MNSSILKGKLKEKNMAQKQFSILLDKDESTVNKKINNIESFTLSEVNKIRTILNLSDAESVSIFFK